MAQPDDVTALGAAQDPAPAPPPAPTNRIAAAVAAIDAAAPLDAFNMYELQIAHGMIAYRNLTASHINPLTAVKAKLAGKGVK